MYISNISSAGRIGKGEIETFTFEDKSITMDEYNIHGYQHWKPSESFLKLLGSELFKVFSHVE